MKIEVDISIHPLWVKLVTSKRKKKRKVGEAERSQAVVASDDDDAPAPSFLPQPLITSSCLEEDLAAIRRFIEAALSISLGPPPFAQDFAVLRKKLDEERRKSCS